MGSSGAIDPTVVTHVRKTVILDGSAGNGAIGQVLLFTVSGEVLILAITPYCQADLSGASATISLGVSGNVSLFVAATVATLITTGKFWLDTGPVLAKVLSASLKDTVITDNIVLDVLIAAVTAGQLRVDIYYRPLGDGSSIIAA